MHRLILGALAAMALGASAALAGPVALTPANPQPDEAALQEGLAVQYAYPADVKSLSQAEDWLGYGVETGEPLIGFDYIDTEDGEKALTSKREHYVVADISGYLKFDNAGVYEIDFVSNDGLQVWISGQEVTFYDGRHPCENAGVTEVSVPEPGWYELKALWFQRLGTSCLLAEWTPPGGSLDWIPNENTAYLPK